jgi:hypothetical protein
MPRYFAQSAIVPDQLVVGGHRLAGEDPEAEAVATAIRTALRDKADPAPVLLAHGVGWIVVDRDAGGPSPTTMIRGLTEEFSGPTVAVYRLQGTPVTQRPKLWRIIVVLAAWTVAVATFLAALVPALRRCYSSVHLTGRGQASWER